MSWKLATRIAMAALLGLIVAASPGAVPAAVTYAPRAGGPLSTAALSPRHPVSHTSLAVARVRIVPAPTDLAPTPPMGWDGYLHFGRQVTAGLVEAQARALVASGMRAAGYRYVIVDGGWDLRTRTAGGELRANPRLFPHGIAPVAAYVHSLGLRFGLYASAGTRNCAGTSAGSYGHYAQDAAAFASWGVDFVKLDWCYIPYRLHPSLSRWQVSRMLAAEFGAALSATRRPMVLEINDTSPRTQRDWTWATRLASTWRTTSDIGDRWRSVVAHFTASVGLYRYARPGHWNSPDFLEVGNPGLTTTEARTQMSLWAEMAAPLIAGNNLAGMSPTTRSILTNRAVIGVDQDPLGQAGRPILHHAGLWVLSRPLLGGDRAVVLFNQGSEPVTITTTARAVGLAASPSYVTVNLWTGAVRRISGPSRARLPAHAVVMFRVGLGG